MAGMRSRFIAWLQLDNSASPKFAVTAWRKSMRGLWVVFAAFVLLLATPGLAQQPIPIVGLLELSGAGASVGSNMKDGLELAAKEINASGGVLGRKLEVTIFDTQTNPSVAKALAQRAIDMNAYAVVGPIFSGSIIVSMRETERAEIANFTGAAAASITQQGNPYVFRTGLPQSSSMPKVAKYIKEVLKARSVDLIYINNDFGKGGRDEFIKAAQKFGIEVAADISTDQNQLDFSGPVLKAKQSAGDVLFAYTNEEESARLLRELRKQGFAKPIIGETTIVNQKVIELAGQASNGVLGHVSLTADAPQPEVKAFVDKFEKAYKYKPDHNALQGYMVAYIIKSVTEKMGKVDSKALAAGLHHAVLRVKDEPGLLLDVRFDAKGDPDRISYLVEVKNGKQIVTTILPPTTPF
jgi:branched-chain amino acid transport system substrate-binding protein